MSCYRGEPLIALQAQSDRKEMNHIASLFGALEQRTAGGNKGGVGPNSALEPFGHKAGLRPIPVTALFPTELSQAKGNSAKRCGDSLISLWALQGSLWCIIVT